MASTSNNKALTNKKATQDRKTMRILFIVTTVAINLTPETAVPSTPTTVVNFIPTINANSTSAVKSNSTSTSAANFKSTRAVKSILTTATNSKSTTAVNHTSTTASIPEQRPNESRIINEHGGKDIPLEVYIVVACIIGTALLVVMMGRPKQSSVGPSNNPNNSVHLFQFYHQPDIEGLHDPRVVRAN